MFGRVVRLPSLFPFKRQQREELDSTSATTTNPVALGYGDTSNGIDDHRLTSQHHQQQPQQQQQQSSKLAVKGTSEESSGSNNNSLRKTLSSLRARQKRKRKEADRQMIFINGKQYYVNDDGELMEWDDKE